MKKTTTKRIDKGEKEPRNTLDLLSRVNDDLVDLPLDADIFSYIARTLQKITPKGTVILVNSLDRKKSEVVLQAVEGIGSHLLRVEKILGRPLKGISFPVPDLARIPLSAGECTELFGGVKTLTFGALPEKACKELEALSFFGKVYGAGISWKGVLHGAVTFIFPPGSKMTNSEVVSQFIRRIAGYLQRRETELALKESEEQLRLAMSAAEIGIWTWNLQTNIMTHTNVGLLFGYTSDELQDYFLHMKTRSHPNDPAPATVIETIFRNPPAMNGALCEFERRILAKGGTWQWALICGKVVECDSSGNPILLMGTIRDITERKLAEEALQESEEKYRALFENANDAIVVHGFLPDGLPSWFTNVNENACRLFGYTRDEMLTRSPKDIDAPEMWEEAQAHAHKLREQGHLVFEGMQVRKGGERFPVEVSAHVFRLNDHTLVLSMIRDITERKRAEEALRESETRLRTTINSNNAGYFRIGLDGRFQQVNAAWLKLHRYSSHDEIIGQHFSVTQVKSDYEASQRNVETLLSGRPIPNAEFSRRCKDGSIGYHTFSASPVTEGGKIVGLEGFLIDTTKSREAQEALRESEERYRSLAESAQDLIYIIDRNDNVVYVNSYCQQMLKKPLEDIIGKPRKALFPESDSVRQFQNLQRVLTTGIPLRIESQVPISGQASWQDTHLMPLRSADGTIHAVLGISRDITEQKALHDAVTLANKKLNLLSSITRHDIINQLMALNGYLDLSQDILDNPVKLEEFITKEQTIANTIETQIRFTKDYQDLGVNAPVWQNVHESVEKAKESLSLRGIAVETDSPPLEIYADPLLVRVFYNLIDNALRYGGEQMTAIRISSQESDHGLMIVCEDNGMGVPGDKKEAIFNRGYFKHTGFGLFLSREILAITGITITENGTPGKGARFEITVPKGAYRFTGTGEK